MATIILSATLVPFAKNQSRLEVAGKTLFSVLINLIRAYPSIRQELFDVHGDLVKAMNLYLNDRTVKAKNWQNIPVQTADRINILLTNRYNRAARSKEAPVF